MATRLKLAVLVVFSVLGFWGCETFKSPTAPPSGSPGSGNEQGPPAQGPPPVPRAFISPDDIIFETNNQRRANGLNSLAENSKLNQAADFKMRDMFARQYFSHYGPDQTSGVPELLARFNYQYSAAGENLALGDFKNAKELVEVWMASPGHRANIIHSVYRDIGVATGYDMFQGRRTMIAVQIFGTPRSSLTSTRFMQQKEADLSIDIKS